MLPVTPGQIGVALLMIMAGATLQGSVGFGMAVVSAPVLLLMNSAFVPGPLLLAAMLLVMLIAHRNRREVVAQEVALGMVGRILGTIPAAYVVYTLPSNAFNIVFAGLVLMAVAISLTGWHISPTPRNVVVAAVLSGFTGTVCSVGGPPMALVYQYEKGPRVRGTMSAIFIFGTIVSLTGLWAVGRFGLVELLLGVMLMPGVVAGFLISRYTTGWIDRARTRPAILSVSALSALVVLARALW